MPASLVFLIVLLVAGAVVLLVRRRLDDAHTPSSRGRIDRRADGETPRALPPGEASPPSSDRPETQEVVHVAEVVDSEVTAPLTSYSSTPPIPLLTPRSSDSPSGPYILSNKPRLASDAGRYSLSSRAPSDATAAAEPLDGSAIPKAPRLPGDEPSPSPRAPQAASEDRPAAASENPPPKSHSPVPASETSSLTPPSEPRTQRGLGVPSPPPPHPRRPGSGSEWRANTVAGLGSFGGSRESRPSSAPPPNLPHEEDAPSSPKAVKTGAAKPVVVQRIRASVKQVARFDEALQAPCDDLARRTARRPRVVLLTAPAPTAALLAEVAVEMAARLGPVCSGRVVLVETDFERPRLRELFGFEVPFGKGFSEQIHGSVRGQEAAQWFVLDADLGFHLLLEGRIRSPGLLWSQDFPEIVNALSAKYRLVLLLAPSHLTEVDKQALDDVCDDVIVVSDQVDATESGLHLQTGLLADKVIRTVRPLAPARS